MESYLNQLYENINDKHKEYNEMLEQHFMDIFNIKRNQLKYLKEYYFDDDDFIIVNDVIRSTKNITKFDREYITFNVTNLNLKPRYENFFGDCTHKLAVNFDSTIHSINYWYNYVEINKYFIHICENNGPDIDGYDFVLILDDKTINKLITVLEISINRTIDINNIQKIEMID